jgi:tRNA threonylcarbamoyladenosine biosynthesis protein TsaE
LVQPPQVFALYGELGAGKTCLAQGLAQGVGIKQWLTSPTYSLIREYSGQYPLVHVDCYRLTGEEDAVDTGLGEILGRSAIVLVEWPEKIERLLPDSCLKIRMTIIDEATRLISIDTKTPG